MVYLKVNELIKVFPDGVRALDGVSLELRKGEILGILGPNGAGKTTLIHCLLGLITPTGGDITAFGLDMKKHKGEALARMNFASNYVSLPLTLTPRENLMVYALMYSVPEPKKKCAEVLALFGLEDLMDKPARRLSSGQMMRLCLCKAMINTPDVLLLDEPTAGLDPEMARKTRGLLKRLCGQRGMGVIYTSHNLSEMQEISDRIVILSGGRVLASGSARELSEAYGAESLEEIYFKVVGVEP